jgi:lipopolysaccharide export system permease protein
MIKLVDRYVGRAAVLGILVVWIVMTILFILFGLLGELRSTQANYTTADAIWFTTMTIPRMAYQVFPVSALLGALVGVGGLAAGNELVAFRTSGISRMRLALAALAGTLLITVPVMIMGEWVAPAAEQQARAFRMSELSGRAIIGGARGMWMRDGNDIVNIQAPLLSADRGKQSVDFSDVVIYGYGGSVELQRITRAQRAEHNGKQWQLEDVSVVEFGEQGATRTHFERRPWDFDVSPELLDSAVTRPMKLSIRSLREYLAYLGQNGLDDRIYRLAIWEKIMFPLNVVALVLAGMPFLFGHARSQNMGVRLFFGMTLGGVFLMLRKVIENVGNVYEVSPTLIQFLPSVVVAVAAILILRRSV